MTVLSVAIVIMVVTVVGHPLVATPEETNCNRVLQPLGGRGQVQADRQGVAFELARLYVSLSKTNGIAAAGDRTKFQALIQAYERKHPDILRDVRLQVQALQVNNPSQGMVSREIVDRARETESWNHFDQEERRRWDVCQRTQQIREHFEMIIGKPCHLIDELDLGKIELLFLDDKNIEHLNEFDFVGLINVQYISIKGNSLRNLPTGLFRGLINLQTILTDDNQIESLYEDQFEGLTQLKRLFFNNNRIEVFHDDQFKDNPSLENIQFTKNNLKAVCLNHFLRLNNLKWFYLSDNPIPEPVKNKLKETAQSWTKTGKWGASLEI